MYILSKKQRGKRRAILIALSLLVILSLTPAFSPLAQADHEPGHIGDDTSGASNTGTNFRPVSNPDQQGAPDTDNPFFDTIGQIRYGDCGLDPLCAVIKGMRLLILGVSAALGALFALLLGVATSFVKVMVFIGTRVSLLPIVTTGFGLTLSFTNVLFVLAIIFMAFATILRIREWSARALLARLVIAAILVNFSFFIAGFILDTSNVFTGVFSEAFDPNELGQAINPQQIILSFGAEIDRITYTDASGSNQSATGENAQNILNEINTNTTPAGEIDKKLVTYQIPLNQDDWQQFFRLLQGLVLAVILTFLLAVSLFALGIMVLVRNFYIAFLLILMPLIWPLSVMPFLKKYWGQWWDTFLKWTIFLPTVSFFIWLAVKTTQTMFTGGTNISAQVSNLVSGDPFAFLVLMIFQTLFIAGLILAGLFVGRRLSITGAALGFAAASWAGSKFTGGAKKVGKFAIRNPGKTLTGIAAAGSLGGAAVTAGIYGTGRKSAKAAKDLGKKALEGVKGITQGAAKKGATFATDAAVGTGVKGFLSRLATGSLSRQGALEKANALSALATSTDDVTKLQKALFSDQSNLKMAQIANGPLPKGPGSDNIKAAIMLELNKRNLGSEVTNLNNIEDLANATKNALNVEKVEDAPAGEGVPGLKEMLIANPHLVSRINPPDTSKGETEEGVLKNFLSKLSKGDLLKIKDVTPAIVNALNERSAYHIAKEGSEKNSQAVIDTLRSAADPTIRSESATQEKVKKLTKEITDLEAQIAKATSERDSNFGYNDARKQLEKLESDRRVATATPTAGSPDAYKKYKYVTEGLNRKPDWS